MKSKNFLMILAGTLVVALGLVGYFLYSQPRDNTQLTDIDSIEKDLNNIELDNIDSD